VCPILMRQDGTRAGRPPNRSRGRRPGNKNSFRLRAPLSDCYGSRRCRRCGGGAVVGGGPSSSPIAGTRHTASRPSHAIMRAMAAAP
jgi:hypothetical protein